jgi:hypothetical protein
LEIADVPAQSDLQLLVQERTGRDIETLLRELYVEKRHSDQEIADAFSRAINADMTRATVQQWRERFGISGDDRAPLELSA